MATAAEKQTHLRFISGEVPVSHKQAEQIGDLQEIIRGVSWEKLKDQTGSEDLVIEEHPNINASILGHWMSVILISGRKLKIAFKVHYSSKNGGIIVGTKSKRRKSEITHLMIFDRLKEYCNLTGGSIKQCLGDENSKTGLSLPFVTRGFDEVLFIDRARRAGKQKIRSVWNLCAADYHVTCSSEVQILDWTCLDTIQRVERTAETEGEIEFL